MKKLIKILVSSWILAGFLFIEVSISASIAQENAISVFADKNPGVKIHRSGSNISLIYWEKFGSGSNPVDAAERFRAENAEIFNIPSEELQPVKFHEDPSNTQLVMYNPDTKDYKFTLVYYSQFRDNIPVYNAELRLLVRNEPGYPIVMASSAVKDLGNFHPDPTKLAISLQSAQTAFAAKMPQYNSFTRPKWVIWAGIDSSISPVLGIEFAAGDSTMQTEDVNRYIIDPATGEILFQESMVYSYNVSGSVSGRANIDIKSPCCEGRPPTPMPWALVYVQGGNSTYTDEIGAFDLGDVGSLPVTVISPMSGQWFQVYDGTSQNPAPPGDPIIVDSQNPQANFMHDPRQESPTMGAIVNAYIHANIVRDFVLNINPSYPAIGTEHEFRMIPNYFSSLPNWCPNARYYETDPIVGVPAIYMCIGDGNNANFSYSTPIYHEYGHHLVEKAMSGQGQYGEGMGDVMAILITDYPGFAYGYDCGSCNTPLRSANNDLTYPCSGEIHDCGTLLSGCVWSTRNYLYQDDPLGYRDILSRLAINAILLHTGDLITPDITYHYLTLDDNDGTLSNGTPHSEAIQNGFGDHSMSWLRQISGEIYDGHGGPWNPDDDGPYYIVDDAYVPNGEMLTINPGTEIRFAMGKKIAGYGVIHAFGVPENPIRIFEESSDNMMMIIDQEMVLRNGGYLVFRPTARLLARNRNQVSAPQKTSSGQ